MVQPLLSLEDYYKALVFYMVAIEGMQQVREHEKLLAEIIVDKNLQTQMLDAIYDPSKRGTKKEFDRMLSESLVTIEWQQAKNKFSKMEGKEE
jgi:hypothetical protein